MQAYVFNRILKGLGSGRGAARQGFAAALTALLENIDAKDTAEILKLAEQHLSLTGAKGTVRLSLHETVATADSRRMMPSHTPLQP